MSSCWSCAGATGSCSIRKLFFNCGSAVSRVRLIWCTRISVMSDWSHAHRGKYQSSSPITGTICWEPSTNAARKSFGVCWLLPHARGSRSAARAALGLQPDKKYLLFAANPEIPVKRFPLARSAAEVLEQQDGFTELLVVHKESQERLALYMSACDVLVFPSYQEGSPNIIKQAMACNLPIVSTDVGDVRQVIGKTGDCYICPPDASKFASVMREILSRRTRTEGRAHIRHLNTESVSEKIIEVYEQVLKNREKYLTGRAQRDSYAPAE